MEDLGGRYVKSLKIKFISLLIRTIVFLLSLFLCDPVTLQAIFLIVYYLANNILFGDFRFLDRLVSTLEEKKHHEVKLRDSLNDLSVRRMELQNVLSSSWPKQVSE